MLANHVDEKGVFHFDGASGTFRPPNSVTTKGLVFFRDEMGIANVQVHFFEPSVVAPAHKKEIHIPIRAIGFEVQRPYHGLEGTTLELKDENNRPKTFKLQLADL